MKTIRLIICLLVFGATIGILTPWLQADEWNKRTKVVLKEPLQIPGTVLQPGTYWFKLLDVSSTRNIVCITNEKENHLYAIVLAIPNYRLTPKENIVLGFWETPRGTPLALRSWFYPGDNFGQEFAYPKKAALKIAAEERAPVPAVSEEIAPKLVAPPEPAPIISELKATPLELVPPPPIEPALAATAAQETPKKAAEKLPETASPLPLLALLGTALAGAGIVLRGLRLRATK
jgi:hypothetical protein